MNITVSNLLAERRFLARGVVALGVTILALMLTWACGDFKNYTANGGPENDWTWGGISEPKRAAMNWQCMFTFGHSGFSVTPADALERLEGCQSAVSAIPAPWGTGVWAILSVSGLIACALVLAGLAWLRTTSTVHVRLPYLCDEWVDEGASGGLVPCALSAAVVVNSVFDDQFLNAGDGLRMDASSLAEAEGDWNRAMDRATAAAVAAEKPLVNPPEIDLTKVATRVRHDKGKELVAHCVAAGKLKFGTGCGVIQKSEAMSKTVWVYLMRYLEEEHRVVKGDALRILTVAVPLVFVETVEERSASLLLGEPTQYMVDWTNLRDPIAETLASIPGLHWTSRLFGVKRPGVARR